MDPFLDFYVLLGRVLLQSAYSGANPDGGWRFGPPPKGADGRRSFDIPDAALADVEKFTQLSPHFPGYALAHSRFADDDSRILLAKLIAYRLLGPERVRLPLSWDEYKRAMAELEPLMLRAATHPGGFGSMVLDLYDLEPAGMPIKVQTTRSGLLAHFFLRQYEIDRGPGTAVRVEPGDVVIEGGMCFGDTALLFAHMAGESGRVIGCEFEPNNLAVMEETLAMNPHLAGRVKVLRRAMWSESGRMLDFAMAGPATVVIDDKAAKAAKNAIKAESLSVDALVRSEKLDKVDFIKLDVEGAEMPTLLGAKETLTRFRPKLALSAYHRPDDCQQFIHYLDSLKLGYVYRLAHFRPHDQETVLFAKCPGR